MSNLFIYTILYGLFSAGIFYPPNEFISMGLTISDLFSSWLGQEIHSFIQYHIKRSVVTLMFHSSIPFGYVVGLTTCGYVDAVQSLIGAENSIWLTLCICTLIGPFYSLCKILMWSRNSWEKHPIAKKLAVYCNTEENRSWMDIATHINREYLAINKLQIVTSTKKIVVTNSWIMQVTPYSLDVAYQENSSLVGCKVSFYSSTNPRTFTIGSAYAKFWVCSRQSGVKNFTIRFNYSHMENFKDAVTMPITTLPSCRFPKSMKELCMDWMKEVVATNPIYISHEEPEKCAVCINAISNIKLTKRCSDTSPNVLPLCKNCNCPPRSCIDCLINWFMTRSVTSGLIENEDYIHRKSSCPQCRATFCLSDICYVKYESTETNDSKT